MTTELVPLPPAVTSHPDGGHPDIDVRFVVAPTDGIFEPGAVGTVTTEGEIIEVDGILGTVNGPGRAEPVRSFCSGFLIRLFVESGQRVRRGQRIAWLQPFGGPVRSAPATTR